MTQTNLVQMLIIPAAGFAASVGVAYATLGGDIRANSKAIDQLRRIADEVTEIRIHMAADNEVRRIQGEAIDRIFRILEGSPPFARGASGKKRE